MNKLRPPQLCPVCFEKFTPYKPCASHPGQVTCSWKCGRKYAGLKMRGKPLTAALAARRKASQARIEAAARQEFGALSAREIAIFQFAAREGYTRGFNKATAYLRRAS